MSSPNAFAVNVYPGRFLDVTPMISALESQPADFEFSRGWLTHVPSRHRFKLSTTGGVTIDARCSCAAYLVSLEQGEQLFRAFASWREFYWRPLEVNREFRNHFGKPSAVVRLFRDIRMAWRRFQGPTEPAAVPAAAALVRIPVK
jgi:hypothetical protein